MKTKRKKINWILGDVFAVPLKDGKFSIGQILSNRMVNVVGIALFDERIDTLEDIQLNSFCDNTKLISLIETTRELLDNDVWKILGNKIVSIPQQRFPNEEFRNENWIGAKTNGAGLVWDFLNAFYALIPWDDWFDPNYLDSYLYDRSKKPTNLIFIKNK